jgi:glucose/arabinose dehydrogenase
VPPKEKQALYKKLSMGGIIRMAQDGKNREVYATGLRNPVGMDFNPKDKTLWSNDNQVDGMGDDIPPGELNRIDKIGEDFGFPWYGGGHTRTNEYKDQAPPPTSYFQRSSRSPMRRTLASASTRATCSPRSEVQERDLLDPAWILESHGAGRRPGDGHLPQG